MNMRMPESRPNIQLPMDEDELYWTKRALRWFTRTNADDPDEETKNRIRKLTRRIDTAHWKVTSQKRTQAILRLLNK